MFRHQGKTRTFKHNLRIATILSFVAGMVNVCGFLAIHQLTTNVTGHFALFINDVADFEFLKGTVYLLFIAAFLVGSFASSFLMELFRENKKLNVFVFPILIESLILLTIALLANTERITHPNLIACALLFAMGLQNSYVTRISNAIVRTTHLTGLFTDLGIEISQLFFPKTHPDRAKLKTTINLRIYIICFFLAGGLLGGFLYSKADWQLGTLAIGGFILLLSLVYDDARFQIIKTSRRYRSRE